MADERSPSRPSTDLLAGVADLQGTRPRDSEGAPSMAPPPASPGGFLRRHAVKLVASAIITLSILFAMQKGGLRLVPEQGSFGQVKWWTLPAYFVTLLGVAWYRAVRWRFLLRSFAEIPIRRIVAVSWVGFAAILILPFRIGEIVRPYMIRQKGKVSATAATGTVLAERIVDGLFLSIVLAVALVFVPTLDPLPDRVVDLPVSVHYVRQSGFVMLGVFATAFATIAVFYFARGWAHRTTLAVIGVVSRPLAEKLAGTAEKLASGLHFLGRPRDAVPFLFETTLYWGLNAIGMWLLAWGCGVAHADGSAITFGETCALMGMLGVVILIPGPPGLIGTFHTGIYAGMAMYFQESVITGPGAAYVFLLYAAQLLWTILAAAFVLVRDRGALRALEEAEGIVPATTT